MKISIWPAGCLIGVLAAIGHGAVSAQVTETSTIENIYSYNLAGQAGSGTFGSGAVEFARQAATANGVSEMFLSLNGTLERGSFLFLHNGTCVGICSLTLTTNITFSLYNGGNAPVALQFDSQITPGHLAHSFLDPRSPSQASFKFAVEEVPGLRQGLVPLYGADGDATQAPPFLDTSDGLDFNGLNLDQNPAWSVLDWSATDLSVAMAIIEPGQTSMLFYRSTLTITTNQSGCLDPTLCESFQVAFGDPRNAGQVLSLSAESFASFLAEPLASTDVVNPAVGAPYDPFQVSYRFAPLNTQLPDPAPVIPPIDYDINYRGPAAVPEPGTWLLLILGFGFAGAMLRRRRPQQSFATGGAG